MNKYFTFGGFDDKMNTDCFVKAKEWSQTVHKITDIKKSFFFDDWDVGGYFDMINDRFWFFHDIFLREYGAKGEWIFWGLIFFLGAIICIYVKLLADILHRSEKNEQNQTQYEENAEDDEENENLSVDEVDELADETENDEITATVADAPEKQKAEIVEQNVYYNDEEDEEMEKRLSAEIVKTSKISDDYLNLKNVLYKQSKENNEPQTSENKEENNKNSELTENDVWELWQLTGVIINMLAHSVSDKKIAQTAYFLNKGVEPAEEIIQLVKALKNFVGYCNTAKFDELPGRENLPLCSEALYALAEGDNSFCMELMESLLNTQVVLAQRQRGLSKDLSYALAADYACTMGTLANLSNYELAINSFELATELAPKNVNALSRCADLYWQDNNIAKAAELYQSVLNLADDVIYPEQKANANLKMAQYYKTAGKMFKADEMEKSGRVFFEDYGIKSPLSDKEKETLQFLLKEQTKKMGEYVKKLLKE